MDKMKLAHDWYLKQLEVHGAASVAGAWQYADAMQAEADERNKSEAEQKRKEVRKMLNAPNTFIEREGQHFDDVNWQPDWSQAPDNLVKYFAVDEDGRGGWFISKPTLCHNHWYWSDFEERVDNDHYDNAPSFGYTGNWQESLRERPE